MAKAASEIKPAASTFQRRMVVLLMLLLAPCFTTAQPENVPVQPSSGEPVPARRITCNAEASGKKKVYCITLKRTPNNETVLKVCSDENTTIPAPSRHSYQPRDAGCRGYALFPLDADHRKVEVYLFRCPPPPPSASARLRPACWGRVNFTCHYGFGDGSAPGIKPVPATVIDVDLPSLMCQETQGEGGSAGTSNSSSSSSSINSNSSSNNLEGAVTALAVMVAVLFLLLVVAVVVGLYWRRKLRRLQSGVSFNESGMPLKEMAAAPVH